MSHNVFCLQKQTSSKMLNITKCSYTHIQNYVHSELLSTDVQKPFRGKHGHCTTDS